MRAEMDAARLFSGGFFRRFSGGGFRRAGTCRSGFFACRFVVFLAGALFLGGFLPGFLRFPALPAAAVLSGFFFRFLSPACARARPTGFLPAAFLRFFSVFFLASAMLMKHMFHRITHVYAASLMSESLPQSCAAGGFL
jgi:hypothetical protein